MALSTLHLPAPSLGFLQEHRVALYAVAASALLVWRLYWTTPRRPENCAFVPEHRFFGSLSFFLDLGRALRRSKHLDLTVEVHEDLGQTWAFKPPLMPWWVLTTCPKNVEHILMTNFDNYPKGSFFTGKLVDLLGHGIFNVDGKEWLHQRKTSSHMFTAKLFKEHLWVVVERNARKLRNIFEASDPEKPVDFFNLMNRFTLDSIGEIGFGKCIGSLDDPTSPFLKSFDRAQQIALSRFFSPMWQVQRFLGIATESDTAIHFGRLDKYSRDVVRDLQARVLREEEGGRNSVVSFADLEARKSFVGLFMQDSKKRGKVLSVTYLRDLVLNFLIAGRDTTAQALSWTMFCMCTHPEVQAKARREVLDTCGDWAPAYEDMNKLPYLQAVISEALRLYPSVPMGLKTATHDDTLPDGTFVPRGSAVFYNIYGMARDRAIWGEDAADFRPERWLEMDAAPGNYKYPVFNAGPRECLGRRLAQVEMKACLATLLPRLSFSLAVPSEEVTKDSQLTIGMGRGLPVFVTPSEEYATSAASTKCLSESNASDREGEWSSPTVP